MGVPPKAQTSTQKSPPPSAAASPISWSWLRCIDPQLFDLDEAPALGASPPFPWKKLGDGLSRYFGLPNVVLEAGELSWRTGDELLTDIPDPRYASAISASGISGTLTCLFSRADIEALLALVLKVAPTDIHDAPSDLVDSFHRFLAMEVLVLINDLDFDKKLSFRLLPVAPDPLPASDAPALSQDISITAGNIKMCARLIIPNAFRASWKQHYATAPQRHLSKERLERIPLMISVEAARASLTLEELLSLHPGDVLFCDHIFSAPDPETSAVVLSLEDRPLFRATLSQGSIKILEPIREHEVYDSMIEKVPPDGRAKPPHTKAFTPSKGAPPPQDEDDPKDEDEEETEEETDFDLFADEDDEEGEEEDFELLSEEQLAASRPKHAAAPESAPPPRAPAPVPAPAPTPAATPAPAPVKRQLEPLSAENIPLTLVIEVARLELSAQKLLELAPGNMLDLHIPAEGGVHLVINGKIVGKGELVQVGESIGMRVLEMGI